MTIQTASRERAATIAVRRALAFVFTALGAINALIVFAHDHPLSHAALSVAGFALGAWCWYRANREARR